MGGGAPERRVVKSYTGSVHIPVIYKRERAWVSVSVTARRLS